MSILLKCFVIAYERSCLSYACFGIGVENLSGFSATVWSCQCIVVGRYHQSELYEGRR